ncbi:GNAT family N-acetyltransferase [Alteromonas alba]|uniref:GNAT family N-acetyltransferase n=1 Tax=Alteromonas alba TaxID=2079529 RepID=A0A2S9V3B7_9ALTE|nr:GNAT family N-acetyltransferase [Alteromonas alba]PRO70957.1 GNAT family N-acetyltransferase [Alteromonas alba]
MALTIRDIDWQDALPVRHEVLWPDKPVLFSRVDGDESATHYGAFTEEKLVCVASIYRSEDSARLRKFATLPDYQGRGIGSEVLAKAIEQLKQQHIRRFWCDALTTATAFYEKFGLAVEGREFIKSGVSYVRMSVNWPETR